METTASNAVLTVTANESYITLQETVTEWTYNISMQNDTEEYLLNTSSLSDFITTSPTETPQDTLAFIYFILNVTGRSVALLIAFFGNAIVFYAYATTKSLRTYTNYYIVGLAVGDFFSGGIEPSLRIFLEFKLYWPFSEAACTAYICLDHLFLQSTFLMTLVICYDRFRALNMPLKHLQEKTTRHACLLISLAYTIPIVMWTTIIIIFPYSGLINRVRPPLCHGPYAFYPVLLIITVLSLSWIPMVTTIILYIFVYSAVIRKGVNKKRSIGEEVSTDSKSRKRVESRATRYHHDADNLSKPAAKATGHIVEVNETPRPDGKALVYSVSAGLPMGQINQAFESEEDDDPKINQEPPEPMPKKTKVQAKSRTKSRGMSRSGKASTKRESRLASLRATRTLTYIFITMLVTAGPWSLFAVWAAVFPYTLPYAERMFDILGWLAHLSSSVNPFCYALSNPVFKKAFLRILRCGTRKEAWGSSRGVSQSSQSMQ